MGRMGVLIVNGCPAECFSRAWDATFFKAKGVTVGDPAFQTYFEILVFLLAAERWCFSDRPTAVFGDNVAALQEALDMKGRKDQLELAQLLAVLRGARSAEISVAHLPTEANLAADALSRQAGPIADRKPWPFRPGQVERVSTISLPTLWSWIDLPE